MATYQHTITRRNLNRAITSMTPQLAPTQVGAVLLVLHPKVQCYWSIQYRDVVT